MSKTATDHALLLTCIQDLYEGCRAFAERYPSVSSQAHDPALRDELQRLIDHAGRRSVRLQIIEDATTGPENLWMAGILDDADRDAGTIARGRHLDIALIGGVRKAIMAELVSLETAIALAEHLARGAAAASMRESRSELGRFDSALAGLLAKAT